MIRATVLAYASIENCHCSGPDSKALIGFQSAATTQTIDDIVNSYKLKLVFKPGII